MRIEEEEYLAHYGILRRSGRYPWGSGNNEGKDLELKDARSFLDYIQYLRKKFGLTEAEVAADLGISTTKLRAQKSIAKSEMKAQDIAMAHRLKEKGYSNVAAAERMGIPESTFRTLIAPGAELKTTQLENTANMLKDAIDNNGNGIGVDVGAGVENHMNISDTQLKTAISMLEEDGYSVKYLRVKQLGTGHETTIKVLAAPGVDWSTVNQNQDKIGQVVAWTEDGGESYFGIKEPIAVDPKRVAVRHAEDGGTEADGVIYVRPGVEDLSLGGGAYAQVRVQVGEGHYLKGMAIYKDDLPEGVDLLFNTNKSDTGNKLDAMKELVRDPTTGEVDQFNRFGSQLKRQILDQPGPAGKVTSAMNIVNEEGDWDNWSKNLASQMLSKQKPQLARQQLELTYERRQKEFDEIMALTNPTVRKKLLQEFAEGTDAASVHLKAAALPRQGSHVILPVESLSPTEIYAPNFLDGEPVVLVRYPHGGVFEIPELRVNNKHPESKKLLGQARDAVGINSRVAEQLSGADFDGDTVLVIPNSQGKVKTATAIKELATFDTRRAYPGYDGMKKMTNTQTEMGKVSNLITDMTIKKASTDEIVRAVKHSMVVIDAEKHGLNYKQSEIDHGIRQLKEKYQTKADGSSGASTLISRAGSRAYVNDRKPRPAKDGGPIDKKTGKKVFVETGEVYYKSGKPVQNRLKALEATDDAHTLSSGTAMERIYADHSNKLKTLANRARKEYVNTDRAKYSPSAKKAYQAEVDSLNTKLDTALRNAPRERRAQVLANTIVQARQNANPTMDDDSLKKIKAQALTEARTRTGAAKARIVPTPREWEAIQAGAISDSKLSKLLDNADMDVIRDLATPKVKPTISTSMLTTAQGMMDRGYTRSEIASRLGVSVGTLDDALYG